MMNGSLMGSILHDVRHAKDLKQQPIRDKIELVGQFSGYKSGQAAGEIISENVSFIGPAKLAKIAGKSKLVSRLSQVPKIEKGLSYIKQARTMLSDNYLSTLARESYGATKDFFRSRLGSLWDDFSLKKLSPVGLDDFRYGEDIGKHTARLYQSTGESAEFQRIRQKLYGEASEQSGRKVGREFSKEASEQLSKHSDDVADAVKAVDKTSDAARVADKVDDVSHIMSISDIDSFRGADIKTVERYLDETLEGYTKAPLKRGDGVRYYDGKGKSWQLNYGYVDATDEIHSGPYLKATVGEGTVRIPLTGGE